MKKIKRKTVLCVILAAFGFNSCISFSEDLNLDKKISLDMRIGTNLTIPLGSLDTIFIDSLIEIKDGSVLDTLEGGYFGIRMSDSIKDVKVAIDSVVLNIDDISLDEVRTHFDNPTPDDVTLNERKSQITIGIPSVDLSSVNASLPNLESAFSTEQISVMGTGSAFHVEVPVIIEEQEVEVGFTYTLPSDVRTLQRVCFGTEKGMGQRVTLNVNLAGVFNLLDNPKITIDNLNVTFPDNFRIAKDNMLDSYIGSGVSVIDNVLNISMKSGEYVSGLSSGNSVLPISLLVMEAGFSSFSDEIDFSDKLKYSLSLKIGGDVSFSGEKKFQVGIGIDEKLNMADLEVSTKNKSILVPSDEISSSCLVSGLDGVSSVESIVFDSDRSHLYVAMSDIDINPFELSSDSYVALKFPSEFEFERTCLTTDGQNAGEWRGDSLVVLLSKAVGKTIDLRVKSLDASKYRIDADKKMVIPNTVSYSGHGTIGGKENVSLSDINSLGDTDFSVSVSGIFAIETANVITDSISTDISSSSALSIDEKVDKALTALKRIDINPANIRIGLHFNGMPKGIDNLTMSNIKVAFPSFVYIDYSGNDADRISVADGGHSLLLNGELTRAELASDGPGFAIDGLKICRLEFEDFISTSDGRFVVKNENVGVSGVMLLENASVSSSDLGDIVVTPSVKIDPIRVNSIYGKVNPEIDPIHEEIELSLGDDLDFLKDGNNRLDLKDPQIILNLDSKVTVPVVMDLALSSYNEDGTPVAERVTPDNGAITIPECAAGTDSRHITLIISKKQMPYDSSNDTVFVRMSHLGDLMEQIPDRISFDLTAKADQSVNHFVDLNREMSLCGNYDVLIPMSFDNLHIEYSDTVDGLSDGLKDVADKIAGDVELDIAADVRSTVPFGVKFAGRALDSNGREMDGIVIDTCRIAPGSDNGVDSKMELVLKVQDGGLRNLESIVLTVCCDVSQAAGGAGLKKGQYVLLQGLKLNIPDGLNVDLTDNGSK